MDGNKDEALKCLRIGKHALQSGDRGRALKFLSKARRLDSALPIDDLLSATREAGGGSGAGSSTPPPANSESSSSAPASAKIASEGSSSSRTYTEEQVAVVRKINTQKDYYEILGLERSCTVEDVRKAYRNLLLKVHPDKNQAPGADEAFKAVSRAFQCLSNEENRKRYDVVRSEEPDYGHPAARTRHGQGFNGFYEEIFMKFFFGGGMAPGMRATTASFGPFGFQAGPSLHNQGGGSTGFNPRSLVQILPVILLLLVNILPAFFPSSEPVYELSRTYQYQYKYETQRGVMYFVKSVRFEEEYPYQSDERMALEKRIEADYVNVVSRNCHQEMQRRQWGFTYQMPHCDILQKYREAASALHEVSSEARETQEKLERVRATAGIGEGGICKLDEDDLEEDARPKFPCLAATPTEIVLRRMFRQDALCRK